MSALDPSYIRSIRDGIINGNIEANNQEALPDGLVGLYDKELFPPTMKWKERKETLHFFLVFAMAQKEISADFAATILGDVWYNLQNEKDTEQDKRLQKVNSLIQLHSKRFSSAGGGKYRLYHERFRLYILQKVSEQDIAQFNNKFITLCETALEITREKDESEKESYALEFISTHYFISAMQGEKGCLNKEQAAALKKHAYDQQFWERQIKASKGFEWSKRMLNQMMSWASKFNEDEIIDCGLQMVDLHHLEQSAGSQIIYFFITGQYEAAFNRLESFDSETRFVLIILALIELLEAVGSIEIITATIKKIEQYMELNFIDIERFNKFLAPDLIKKVIFKLEKINIKLNLLNEYTNKNDLEWIEPISANNDLGKTGNLGIVYNLLLSDKMEEASMKFAELVKTYAGNHNNIIYTSKSDLMLLKEISEKIVSKPDNVKFLAFLRGLRGSVSFYDVSYIFLNDYQTLRSLVFENINSDEISVHNQIKVRKDLSEYAAINNIYILKEKLLELYTEGELQSENYSDDYNRMLLDLVEWKLEQNKNDDAHLFIQRVLKEAWGSQLDEARIFNSLISYRKNAFSKAYEIINEIEDEEYKLKAFYALYFDSKKNKNFGNQEGFIKESISFLEEGMDEFDLFHIYKNNSLSCFDNNWSAEFIEFTEKMMIISEKDFYTKMALCDFYNKISQKEKIEFILDDLIADFDNLGAHEKVILLSNVVSLNRKQDVLFLNNKLIQLKNEEDTPNSELSNIVVDLVSLDFLSIAVPLLNNVQITSEFIKLNQRQVCQLIPLLSKDVLKIKHLLQMHSLSYLFFQKDSHSFKEEKIKNTLNLQWAIDIKNQLPN
jgi:hypothetical protein